MLGIALGCIRLSYDDFCRLEFEEFAAIHQAYAEQCDAEYKNDWDRMRMLATITIQPHLSKGKRLTPEKLLPYPWDKERKAQNKRNAPQYTKEQRRKRMEDLAEKLKN